MGLRDDEHQLSNEVELDDGFFETVSVMSKKAESLKRGRGSQRQTTVLVMAENQEIDEEHVSDKYKHNKSFKSLKTKVINGGFKQELFTSQVEKNIEKNSAIISDGSTSVVLSVL